MSNPTYEYNKHFRENLPNGVVVDNQGRFVVAETKLLPNYKTSKLYLDQLVRNGYDFTPTEAPEIATQPSLTPASVEVGQEVTVSLGTATGLPEPTAASILRLNGVVVNPTAGKYTPTEAGNLELEVTWSNGTLPNATATVTSTVTVPEPEPEV